MEPSTNKSPRAEPGYRSGTTLMHLTKTLLGSTAYCGARVDMIGVPQDAEICEPCNELATEAGAQLGLWAQVMQTIEEVEKP